MGRSYIYVGVIMRMNKARGDSDVVASAGARGRTQIKTLTIGNPHVANEPPARH